MNIAANTAEFIADLISERDGAAKFVSLLAAEQNALRDGIVEHLEMLARDKSGMARRLSELGERRTRYLIALGFSPDSYGMDSWINNYPRETGALAAWHDLRRLAVQAREANQTNGTLIDLRLRHNQQALAALENASGATTLYGPQGQTMPLPRARRLSAV